MLPIHIGDLDDRDIESAAAQIVYRDFAVALLFFEAISQRRCSRLVDDAFDFKSCDSTGIFGGLTL